MIALVDIGNTRFKYIVVETPDPINISIKAVQKVYSQANHCWGELWFEEHFNDVNQIILANVAVEHYSQQLQTWCDKSNKPLTIVKSQPFHQGVKNGYHNYKQLGIDRWLAVLGAHQLRPNENLLIVDSGTATTIDVLDQEGLHHGGWILPGIEMMSSSILSATSQVKGEVKPITSLSFGLDSSENLSNASWAATLGMIEKGVMLAEQKLHSPVNILLTGGNGTALAKHLSTTNYASRTDFVNQLIFIGLACYIDN